MSKFYYGLASYNSSSFYERRAQKDQVSNLLKVT